MMYLKDMRPKSKKYARLEREPILTRQGFQKGSSLMNSWDEGQDRLPVFRVRLQSETWRALREAYEMRRAQGLTQTELARRIGKTECCVWRRLAGGVNLTLASSSDLARGMGFRP